RWVPSDALADRWILAELNSTIKQVTEALEEYRLNEVAQTLYHFFWNEFCDWYIEFTKTLLLSKEETNEVRAARNRIAYVLETSLRLLHPLMPFITEELWQQLPHEGESIMVARWPEAEAGREDSRARAEMETLIAVITKVRNIRSEMNIPVQSRVKLHIGTADEGHRALLSANTEQIKRLARVEEIQIADTLPPLESAARDIVTGIEIGVPLGGLIDVEKEGERITKEITRKENEARGLQSRLDNASFVERAPSEVVEQARERLAELLNEIEKLKTTFVSLGGD
ncbi:MAG TPA: class I tRNA ligase family protein, partial [Blastocatellia bacterium]|nr:class I tRNA ligase family protein [Blastocatellia bacterium]